MNGEKRYHAEVHVTWQGREARINFSADTLVEIFQDVGTISIQFPQDSTNPAKREIVNTERKAAQLRQPAGKPAAKAAAGPAGSPQETGEIPVCESCGSSEFMELIKFTDKTTGKPRQSWKCQRCLKWYWPNGKKNK